MLSKVTYLSIGKFIATNAYDTRAKKLRKFLSEFLHLRVDE